MAERKPVSVKKRKRIRKLSIKQKFQIGSKIVRAGLDTYSAFKRKDPLYGGMAIASTVDTISEIYENIFIQDVSDWLNDQEVKQIFPYDLRNTVDKLLEKIGVRKTLIWTSPEDEKYQIFSLMLAGVEIFDRRYGGSPHGLYAEDIQTAKDALQQEITKRMGNFLQIAAVKGAWSTEADLREISPEDEVVIPFEWEEALFQRIHANQQSSNGSRTVIFAGPPGVGKSKAAIRLANHIHQQTFFLKANDLNRLSIDQNSIYSLVSIVQPHLLIIDDIDRVSDSDGLIGVFDDLKATKSVKLIVSTVNYLDSLPDAVRRPGRSDLIVKFGLPDEERRKALLKKYVEYFKTRLSDDNLSQLAELTKGLTEAHMREIALRATEASVPILIEEIKIMKELQGEDNASDEDHPSDD